MGNTKTYYAEGELLPGVTLDQFKEAVYDGFHSTYCVAEIVEQTGGYLGNGRGGPFLVAAIHSYSLIGDEGPGKIAKLFKYLTVHRLDRDWSDIQAKEFEDGELKAHWKSEAPLNWDEVTV